MLFFRPFLYISEYKRMASKNVLLEQYCTVIDENRYDSQKGS